METEKELLETHASRDKVRVMDVQDWEKELLETHASRDRPLSGAIPSREKELLKTYASRDDRAHQRAHQREKELLETHASRNLVTVRSAAPNEKELLRPATLWWRPVAGQRRRSCAKRMRRAMEGRGREVGHRRRSRVKRTRPRPRPSPHRLQPSLTSPAGSRSGSRRAHHEDGRAVPARGHTVPRPASDLAGKGVCPHRAR